MVGLLGHRPQDSGKSQDYAGTDLFFCLHLTHPRRSAGVTDARHCTSFSPGSWRLSSTVTVLPSEPTLQPQNESCAPFILCVQVLDPVYAPHTCALCPKRQEVLGSPEAAFTGGHEPPSVGAGNQTQVLWKGSQCF